MEIRCQSCGTRFDPEANGAWPQGPAACPECGHPAPPPDPTSDPAEAVELPPVFVIVSDESCPLYTTHDEFQLTQQGFWVPHGKAPCLILAKDIRNLLRRLRRGEPEATERPMFKCSGCTGQIRFARKSERLQEASDPIETMVDLLAGFSIFEGLERDDIRDVASLMRMDQFEPGDIVLRKGEIGRNLFIVIQGRGDVLSDDGMGIAAIGRGEVFGEMSLLSGSPVGATVRVAMPTTMMRISVDHFRKILDRYPSLQMSFTRLLVRRMAEINRARSDRYASGLAGKLSEMPPPDLFQTFNINQKTGVLTLKLPQKKTAQLSFREGKLVDVEYDGRQGEDAFFELLKLKEGHFKYFPGLSPEKMQASEIGDFMYLIIEGLRRIEQDDRDFLRTVIPTLV